MFGLVVASSRPNRYLFKKNNSLRIYEQLKKQNYYFPR